MKGSDTMFNNDVNDPHRYDDLIDLPHHVSPTRPRMPLNDRAAQFAPFAALTGYGAAIKEAARLTDRRIELGDAERAELDARLRALREPSGRRAEVRITRFIPDRLKEGGRYETVTGIVRQILPTEGAIMLADGAAIDLDDIIAIEGEIFDRLPPE